MKPLGSLELTRSIESLEPMAQIAREECVYDRDSWHRDCAEYLVSADPVDNDKLRGWLIEAYYWLQPRDYANGVENTLSRACVIQMTALQIGNHIIEMALKNNLTLENLGERS